MKPHSGKRLKLSEASYKVSPRGSLVLEASYWLLEVSQRRSLVGGLLLEASCWVPSISGLLWETSYNRNLLMEASYWRRSTGELLRETSNKSSIGTPAWRPSLGGLRGLGRKECPGTVPGLSRDCPGNIGGEASAERHGCIGFAPAALGQDLVTIGGFLQ